MNGGKLRFGMPQRLEQGARGAETPLDPGGLTGEQVAAGVRKGRPGQSAASAGPLPVVWRSSCAVVSRNSLRGTTASTMP